MLGSFLNGLLGIFFLFLGPSVGVNGSTQVEVVRLGGVLFGVGFCVFKNDFKQTPALKAVQQ